MATHNLFDLNRIYNPQFSYSLPRPLLEKFASGIAFDCKEKYTDEEFELLKQDIQDIWNEAMTCHPSIFGYAIISAGAPGAGKTTLMRSLWEQQKISSEQYAVYVCPDDVMLRSMKRTFQNAIWQDNITDEKRREAYTKWRPASNFATHLVLANLILNHYNFYFGTTASSPESWKLFDFLKQQKYTIKVLHVTASDDVRIKSIHLRDRTFIQTTDQDIREKGRMIHERIIDTFLKYANIIDFYFRYQVDQPAVLGARWSCLSNALTSQGRLHVIHLKAYEEIRKLHDQGCSDIHRPELMWENSVLSASI